MSWIQTRTGHKFDLLRPRPQDVNLIDIAWSLSMQCRFNGHTSRFYSVAQHSVLVSRLVEPRWALYGLLHDAAEAYLCDIPSPIKPLIPEYKGLEANVQAAVLEAFGCAQYLPPEVHLVDKRLTQREAELFMAPLHPEWFDLPCAAGIVPLELDIEPWSPQRARETFGLALRSLVGWSYRQTG